MSPQLKTKIHLEATKHRILSILPALEATSEIDIFFLRKSLRK